MGAVIPPTMSYPILLPTWTAEDLFLWLLAARKQGNVEHLVNPSLAKLPINDDTRVAWIALGDNASQLYALLSQYLDKQDPLREALHLFLKKEDGEKFFLAFKEVSVAHRSLDVLHLTARALFKHAKDTASQHDQTTRMLARYFAAWTPWMPFGYIMDETPLGSVNCSAEDLAAALIQALPKQKPAHRVAFILSIVDAGRSYPIQWDNRNIVAALAGLSSNEWAHLLYKNFVHFKKIADSLPKAKRRIVQPIIQAITSAKETTHGATVFTVSSAMRRYAQIAGGTDDGITQLDRPTHAAQSKRKKISKLAEQKNLAESLVKQLWDARKVDLRKYRKLRLEALLAYLCTKDSIAPLTSQNQESGKILLRKITPRNKAHIDPLAFFCALFEFGYKGEITTDALIGRLTGQSICSAEEAIELLKPTILKISTSQFLSSASSAPCFSRVKSHQAVPLHNESGRWISR